MSDPLSVKDLPKFGKKLRQRREQLNLTPTEVAKRADINLATLLNIEEARLSQTRPRAPLLPRQTSRLTPPPPCSR